MSETVQDSAEAAVQEIDRAEIDSAEIDSAEIDSAEIAPEAEPRVECGEDARTEADAESSSAVASAVPAPTPVVGGLTAFLFGGRNRVAEDLGPSAPAIIGEPGERALDHGGWKGAPKLAEALIELAFGRCAPADSAIRLIAVSVDSPIARRVLPECAELAARGTRFSLILSEEPRQADAIEPIAALSRALGTPRLDDFLRIADFPGAEICLEQAMIGDRFYWTGEPLARRRPTPLAAGGIVDLTRSEAAPDAARLRFAAAWRLAAEPSDAFCRRVAAAARALGGAR